MVHNYKHYDMTTRLSYQDHGPHIQRLEVAAIFGSINKAYVLGLSKGISPQNMALYGTVPPF